MTKRQIREEWNSAAAEYDQFVSAPDSYSQCIEWPCIRSMLPDVAGKRVLERGCGTGNCTFRLEEYAPKTLIGIDLSDEMLRNARTKARQNGPAAAFIRGDAKRAYLLAGDGYDLVLSAATAHCIRELEAFLTSAGQCLKPGGCCILSVVHLLCTAGFPVAQEGDEPELDDARLRYLDQRLRAVVQPWSRTRRFSHCWHHTFGDYVNAALRAGLTLCDVQEPHPPQSWLRTAHDRYECCLAVPPCLILKLTK